MSCQGRVIVAVRKTARKDEQPLFLDLAKKNAYDPEEYPFLEYEDLPYAYGEVKDGQYQPKKLKLDYTRAKALYNLANKLGLPTHKGSLYEKYTPFKCKTMFNTLPGLMRLINPKSNLTNHQGRGKELN